MKKFNKTLLVILAVILCVFCFVNNVSAKDETLSVGKEVAISNLEGNLNNINIKVEFTSTVELDGTNNALLVGFAASDGTVLTDEKFVASQAIAGVYDKNGTALVFDEAPLAVGSKEAVEGGFKYSFETRDFAVVNGEKAIAKLVVTGTKGADVVAQFTFSEVKYSVQFGSLKAVSYSYNEVIAAPESTPSFTYTVSGHKPVTGWAENSNAFVQGESKATKDVVYSVVEGAEVAHNWGELIPEVAATEFKAGVKAHYECSCGAKIINQNDAELASSDDLRIAQLNHTHTFVASFDWSEATNPGDKPVVTYTCACEESHTMDASDVAINEKADSRSDSTCAVNGKVTYVASCTYESVQASDEKEYTLAKLPHTPTHHDAVAQSLEAPGCVEHWTCSGCNGYFLDEDCTQASTEEGVVLPQYTLEEAQVISTKELGNGATMLLLNNELYNFGSFTKANKSLSLQFKWNIVNTTDGDRLRFHLYFCSEGENEKWVQNLSAWFVLDQSFIRIRTSQTSDNTQDAKKVTMAKGLHDIAFTAQAIMNGDNPTGKYLITIKFDGNTVFTDTQEYDSTKIKPYVFVNGSKTYNCLYDKDYTGDTFEEAEEVNVYDLNALGYIKNVSSYKDFAYTTDSQNYSRIFKFNLCQVATEDSYFGVNFGSGDTSGLMMRSSNKNKFYFAWGTAGHWTDCYYIGGDKDTGMDKNINYEVEIGRIRITEGVNAGKDLLYVKVDGEYLRREGDGPHKLSWFYVDPQAEKGYPTTKNVINMKVVGYEVYDVNYTDPVFEEADIISVNDLVYNGTYQNGEIDLMADRVYTYHGNNQYGSVVFKGVFNFAADAFNDGNKNGTQVRFNGGTWENDGLIWFNGGAGTLIWDETVASKYVVGSKLATGSDQNVEIGRLALMNGEEFSGVHYLYVKINGVLVAETITNKLTEEIYSLKSIFFTGKPVLEDNPETTDKDETSIGNTGNVIKNVEMKKTVTVKVGTHSENVEVLQSGLVVIPTFGTEVVPADKRIVGWTIEGTETEFNPLADHIFEDITIVAKLDDFKWEITFGTEKLYFTNGAEITLPENNPTKDYDETNHYAFAKWVDAEGQEFVAGTIANADMVFTAEFTATPHSYGDWSTVSNPTCDQAGSKTRECTCGHVETAEIPAAHSLVHHDAKAESCEEDGNIEYWSCSACELMFSDEAATTQVTEITIAKHHTMVKVNAQAESCDADGNIEYWTCSVCHMNFTAEDAATEITQEQYTVAKHHTLTHVEAKEPSCTKDGNVEYWSCSACNKNFSDQNGTTELQTVVDPKHHTLTHVAAQAATCDEDGNVEYWSCSKCRKLFSDANGNNQVTSVVDPSEGHQYVDGKCTVCGHDDPSYVAPIKVKGCGSTILVSLFTTIALAGCALVIAKRKENE